MDSFDDKNIAIAIIFIGLFGFLCCASIQLKECHNKIKDYDIAKLNVENCNCDVLAEIGVKDE